MESIEIESNSVSDTNSDIYTSSFIWQIPSLSKQQTKDLCNGYIHIISTKYIPIDMIEICIKYIDDSTLISDIKNAKNGQGFKSKFFSIGKFKFFMDLYPNGYAMEAKGNMDIFLNLASLSPIIPRLTVKYCLIFNEMKQDSDTTFSEASFNDNDISSCISRIPRDDIIDIDTNTFTFTLKIKTVAIYNEIEDNKDNDAGADIEYHPTQISTDLGLCSQAFIWFLDTINGCIANGKYYESEMFLINVFKFIFKIYKTNDGEYDLCLCLLSLSPAIERLCLYYRLILHETGTQNDGSIAFGSKSLHFWPQTFLTNEHMTKYNKLRIKIEISVMDIFDIDGESVLNYKQLQNADMTTKCSRYEWKISAVDNDERLNEMKIAKHGVHFNSDCFSMHQFSWFMQLFPGGYNDESNASADLFLYLVSIPPNISYIAMNYSMTLKENATNFTYSEQFSMDNFLTGWPSNALKQKDLENMNELTFGIDINIIDVFDIDGHAVTSKYVRDCDEKNEGKAIALPSRRYVWNINGDTLRQMKNGNVRKCFMSSYFQMYGLKWYLQFFNLDKYPSDGSDEEEEKKEQRCQLYVALVLPSNIKRISFQYELIIPQLQIIHSHFEQFTQDDTTIGLSNIKKPQLSDIQKLNELTFETRINLIDVYDQESENITSFYVNKGKVKEIDICKHEYIWNISERNMVERLKNAGNGEIYRSKLFCMESLKFMMQICPNGSNPKRCGSFNWYIYIASIPPNIAKVAFYYNFELKLQGRELESNVNDLDSKELRVGSCSWGWGNNILKKHQIKDVKQLIFKLEMAIIDIFTVDGDVIARNEYGKLIPSPLQSMIMDEYKWNIDVINDEILLQNMKNAANGICFYSETFGKFDEFEWRLQFFPNGSTKKFKKETILCINLLCLPANIGGISIYFELQIMETKTRWTHCSHFRHNHLSQGWETARCSLKEIQKLDKLTLTAKIHLIDVYDTESNVITQKYFDCLPNVSVDDEYLV